MAPADISPIVSALALIISVFTAWFTIFRRGTVCSTHPSVVAFRYDFVERKPPQAKIFLRTLLFSTGKRGQVIESLFLRVHESSRNAEFSYWGYGEKELVRGSGLFVPETGVANNHHFNPIAMEPLFLFSKGVYTLELVAKLLGSEGLTSLWEISLEMPSGTFDSSIARNTVVYFNWSIEQKCYIASVEQRSN